MVDKVSKGAATTAKKRRPAENHPQRYEVKERQNMTSMGHREEGEREKSSKNKSSRQKSKSHYKQREQN